MILPNIKQFICFECKRDGDISRGTKDFPLVNQIFRNLESAFLLTKIYKPWDFNYIFLCPYKIYKYKASHYAYLIRDIKQNSIGELYKDLRDEYKFNKNSEKYLPSFISEIGSKVSVAHWQEFNGLIPSSDLISFPE